jgi:hypothetical protein
MRLLIGTMHSNEQEFEACVSGIRAQQGVQFEHIVLENLPHKEAHDKLYSTFMENASRFDVFVKVDSDMVITNKYLFAAIADRFKRAPAMDELAIAVHDFFPDRLVYGMYSYRNTVRWDKKAPLVFSDEEPEVRQKVFTDAADIAPAALHCPNPSPLQCLRYGVVRGVKILEAAKAGWFFSWPVEYIKETWAHFKATRDRRLILASLGAELALDGRVNRNNLDYTDPFLRNLFVKYEVMPTSQLARITTRLRIVNRVKSPVLLLMRSSSFRDAIRKSLANCRKPTASPETSHDFSPEPQRVQAYKQGQTASPCSAPNLGSSKDTNCAAL